MTMNISKTTTSPLRTLGMSSLLLLLTLGAGGTGADAMAQTAVAFSGDGFNTFEPSFSAVLGSLSATFTEVPRDTLANTVSTGGFSMIWLDGFSTFNGLPTAQLQNFVENGGTLVVQSPGFGGNSLSEFPKGSEIEQITYTGWDGNGEPEVRIMDSLHPLMAGLTNAGLNWKDANALNASGHTSGSIGGFHGLVDNGTSGQWVTLVQDVGSGHLVYTFEDISRRLAGEANGAQAADYLKNLVTYAVAVPEPSTIVLGSLGAMLLWPVLRRRPASGRA